MPDLRPSTKPHWREGLAGLLLQVVGPTARLEALPAGWSLEDHGRLYRLTLDNPREPAQGFLEAWARGRYHAAAGDWSLSAVRGDFARFLARGDTELERHVRGDLFRFSMAVRLLVIDAALLDGLDEEAVRCPRLTALVRGEPEHDSELVIFGLQGAKRAQVTQLAREWGGQVFRRRA